MKDMVETTFVIGIKIFRDRSQGLLGLFQEAYIKTILNRFRMEGCRPQVAPMKKGDKFNVQGMNYKGNKWTNVPTWLQ